MTLAIQLLGCVGAVLVIALLVRGDTNRPTIAVSTAVLATVVVSLVGLQGLWPTAQKHLAAAKAQRNLTPVDIATGGGRTAGINADFVEWAAGQTAGAKTYTLVPFDPTVHQWISYRMLPRLERRHAAKGDWLVFYNTTPARAGYRRSQLSDIRIYQPKFSVARLEVAR